MSLFHGKRITAIISQISCNALADVACEHAYISIGAVLQGRAERAVACDKSTHAVLTAEKNIARYERTDKIEARLSDGLKGIDYGEVDTVVIAGIGGRLMRDILTFDTKKTMSFPKYVLSPQSEPELVKCAMRELGYVITDDILILDRKKIYTVISFAKKGFLAGCMAV